MIKAFDKWETTGIKVEDPGLVDYITLSPRVAPRSGATYAGQRFHKSKTFIVERLMNKVMIPGHRAKKHKISSSTCTGKSQTAYKIIENTLEIIEKKTKQNPIAILVKALENAAPREEIIAIEYGGARYPKAVECAPQRRVDLALRNITQGAYAKAFKAKIKIEACLANEIINAFNLSGMSNSIAKKNELERQADSSR